MNKKVNLDKYSAYTNSGWVSIIWKMFLNFSLAKNVENAIMSLTKKLMNS